MEVDNIDKENLESASNHTVDLTDENKDAETNELNDNQKTPKSKITESAKKRRAESQKKTQAEKEEEKRKREEEKRKKDEERERLKQEKAAEAKRKEEEREKLRLEKLEEAKKKEEEKKKKEEEREKQRLEKLEKEKKRLELLQQKNEEKKRKEEEKQREENEKKAKEEKVKQQFCSFFIKKEVSLQQKEEIDKSTRFMPFQVKQNMFLAPTHRRLSYDEKRDKIHNDIDGYLEQQATESSYLKEIKNFRRYLPTLELKAKDKNDIVEIETNNTNKHKFKVKYLQFDPKLHRRPPYYGTWRKKSLRIKPTKPFEKDTELIDYEIDSDDEWEDPADGESIGSSDEEDEEIDDDEDEDDGFFVPHGHLSDDEIDEEIRITEPALKEAQEKAKIQEWEAERSKKAGVNILKVRFIGCIWDSSEKQYEQLEKYKMVQLAPNLPIQFAANSTSANSNDQSTKSNAEDTPKQNKNSKSQQQQVSSSPASAVKSKPPKAPPKSANNTPKEASIVKFISKIKKDDSVTKESPVAEKRSCGESDTNNGAQVVKRLKLDDSINTDMNNQPACDENMIIEQDCTNKENCIVLE